MKKNIGVIVLLALLLGSCSLVETILNPVIGTWETTILGLTVTSVFNADDTFTDTNSLGSLGVTESGTWTSDSTTITKTWSDESTDEFTYSFNSDNTEMNLSLNPDGLVVIYSRQ